MTESPDRVTASLEQTPYAVVDIGSNSVRLVVYDCLGRAPLPRFNEKSLCRLGAGLAETGELSESSFQQTVSALRRFRAVADAMGVERVDVIATEAVRRASNGDELVAAIVHHTGFAVRVLTGEEEARYASLGVVAGIYEPAGVVGDMGGGSLEIAEIRDRIVGERSASMPLGALPVQALLGDSQTYSKRQVDARAKRAVDEMLADGLPPDLNAPVFYAVGGGWRSFARVHMAATNAPVRVAHGYAVDAREARAFAKAIWRMPEAKIGSLAGLPSRRIPTLRASSLMLDRVLKALAPEHVVFSALGVREGWLYAQLSQEEQRSDPLLVGARNFGAPQARVPAFAEALARWTAPLFSDESADEMRTRVAACSLSDIAWRDDANVRAAESFRRLVQFPFIGLDHEQRVFIAAVIHARYGGSTDDASLAPAIEILPQHARQRALLLGRVMQLGYRISGSVPDILASSRLQLGSDVVRLEVGRGARVPDSEVVGARLKLIGLAAGARRTEIVETSIGT